MAGFRGQRSGALTSVEVKNGLFGFLWLFWLNSLDQPPFQPQLWPLTSSKAKKRSVFAVFMVMMAMTYMLLDIFSLERIRIINDKKHWQYDGLTCHKVWGSSSNFSFLRFHTNNHLVVYSSNHVYFCTNSPFLAHCVEKHQARAGREYLWVAFEVNKS